MPLMNHRPPDDFGDIAEWRLWMLIAVCGAILVALPQSPAEPPAGAVTEEEKP